MRKKKQMNAKISAHHFCFSFYWNDQIDNSPNKMSYNTLIPNQNEKLCMLIRISTKEDSLYLLRESFSAYCGPTRFEGLVYAVARRGYSDSHTQKRQIVILLLYPN
jgi:hypothetical protein